MRVEPGTFRSVVICSNTWAKHTHSCVLFHQSFLYQVSTHGSILAKRMSPTHLYNLLKKKKPCKVIFYFWATCWVGLWCIWNSEQTTFFVNLVRPFRSVSGIFLLPQDAVVLKTFGTTDHLCGSLPGFRPDRGTATSSQRDMKMFCVGCAFTWSVPGESCSGEAIF